MEIVEHLKILFEKTFDKTVIKVEPLPRSASYRQYFRLISDEFSAIGTYNPNKQENTAFIYMSDFFMKKNLPVPVIYAKDMEKNIYIQQDLGSETLLNHINTLKFRKKDFIPLLEQVIEYLVQFQTATDNTFDWSKCYPVAEFDKTAYSFDLNYFKYTVLKILKAQFHELRLEEEFSLLTDFLLSAEHKFFVYRDFQTRNIMWFEKQLYFIDYQGGRKGSLFYDIVSLLFDTKLELTRQQQEYLKDYYFSLTKNIHNLSRREFETFFYAFAFIRKVQALAAYVFRGLVENKLIFILGLEKAFEDVFKILSDNAFPLALPELKSALKQAYENLPFKRKSINVSLEINSFSFLYQGYPPNNYGNGGGFVFDCRTLPNPGHLDEFRNLSGLDAPVQQWLEAQPQVEDFIVRAFAIVYNALEGYQRKGYTHLQVNFGCTGGHHRSVYCAEKLAKVIRNFLDIPISVNHLMQDKWNCC